MGSIGVVSMFEKDDEDKTIEIVSSQSPNKRPDINTDEGRAKIQARVDELAEVFIAKVARNRGITVVDVVKNFGVGDVSVGKSAVRSGLADGLASFEGIIADFNKEKTFMNDTININAEEIRQTERERMAKVFAADISKGKEATGKFFWPRQIWMLPIFWKYWTLFQVPPKQRTLKKRWRQLKTHIFRHLLNQRMKHPRQSLSVSPLLLGSKI